MIRRIVHVDMDAFYASVEQVDSPDLRGLPVIIGASHRGVVSAASYEARKFGVRSAMPVFKARHLCPDGIFLPVRMARYREVSCLVMEELSRISPVFEQVSIDEAFIDATGTEALHGTSENLALKIKISILRRTSLTCSVGVAPNKFLAKISSDINKPDGMTILEDKDLPRFLDALPVEKIPGIGAKSAARIHEFGVRVASDVLKYPLAFWTAKLGKMGVILFERAQGIDSSPVVSHSKPKSCSAEDTFPEDTESIAEIEKWLLAQAESVGRSLRQASLRGRTVTLKIKTADFRLMTRSQTLSEPTDCTQVIFDAARKLFSELRPSRKVRLAGVGVSNFAMQFRQSKLYPDKICEKQTRIDDAMDRIREKFGKESLKRGRLFDFDQ
jgi:DNA polymerase-4